MQNFYEHERFEMKDAVCLGEKCKETQRKDNKKKFLVGKQTEFILNIQINST